MTGATKPAAAKTNKLRAQALAGDRAAAALVSVDLSARCKLLGLAEPDADGAVRLTMLGRELRLGPPRFDATIDDAPAAPADRILALHYLLGERPVEPAGRLISFRDLPGGQFYYGPFHARSGIRLAGRVGNDLPALKRMLARVPHRRVAGGDLAAEVPVVERVALTLVYYAGDDELPPSAEILFDESIRRAYCTEDAAALAARLCVALIGPCETCHACGMCEKKAQS